MNTNTISNSCEKKSGFCPHHLPFPETTTPQLQCLSPWFTSYWQFLFPCHHPCNQGSGCGFSNLATPTWKALPFQLLALVVSSSHIELLPQQVTPHKQSHSRICFAPLRHHPQGASFSIHPSPRIPQKWQFKWTLWSLLRNICQYSEPPGYDTHHFSNGVAAQQPNNSCIFGFHF